MSKPLNNNIIETETYKRMSEAIVGILSSPLVRKRRVAGIDQRATCTVDVGFRKAFSSGIAVKS